VQQLPGSVVLAPNERVVAAEQFIFSPLLFFLSTRVVLTDQRVAGERPNTLLGLIPVGAETFTYPLASVSAVATSTRLSILRVLVGAVLALVGLANYPQSWLVLLIGFLVLLGALRAAIRITNQAGQTIRLPFFWFTKGPAQAFVDVVNTTIAARDRQQAPG
jgi:hypothetical protein